ncbi:MAG TPA: hypothetical protein VGI48_04650 [Caldimonas sp.]|jgi:hypothetical protein
MSYAIDRLHTFDLIGGTGAYEFDVGVHAASGTVYVARAMSGPVQLGTWSLGADGSFTSAGSDHVVGHGSRTRIVVFDNQRFVVLWLDTKSSLRARGYAFGGNSLVVGDATTVESTIANFDLVSVGVTTGVQHSQPGVSVYYNYRQFAFTTLSENGDWKLWLGTVTDSAEVSVGPAGHGGTGDKVVLSCASVNENHNGAQPRKALTLWRDAGQIRTRSWRVAHAGVTSLASAAETKPLGVGAVHGMSMTQGNDFFATLVWPGASNATARLQLVSLAAGGAMSTYASAEFAEAPTTFARLQTYGSDAAVAYTTPEGHLAVAAWRFAAPGSTSAARTVLASKVGTEQPTEVRLASLIPLDDNEDDTVRLVTLNRVAAGALRLVSWQFRKFDYYPTPHPTSDNATGP